MSSDYPPGSLCQLEAVQGGIKVHHQHPCPDGMAGRTTFIPDPTSRTSSQER